MEQFLTKIRTFLDDLYSFLSQLRILIDFQHNFPPFKEKKTFLRCYAPRKKFQNFDLFCSKMLAQKVQFLGGYDKWKKWQNIVLLHGVKKLSISLLRRTTDNSLQNCFLKSRKLWRKDQSTLKSDAQKKKKSEKNLHCKYFWKNQFNHTKKKREIFEAAKFLVFRSEN